MIEGRVETNFLNNNNHINYEFCKLKEYLKETYGITGDTVIHLEEKLPFEMEFNQISAQQLLNHIEAELVNNKKVADERFIIETLMNGVTECLKKNKGKKKGNIQNRNAPINNYVHKQIQLDTNVESINRDIKIETLLTYNEKGLNQVNFYNNSEISYTFFSNLELNEYTLIPKDEEVKLDDYQKYFQFFKNIFLESIGVVQDNPLLDIDKFFLLVIFENTEGKPVLTDIALVDPLKNYTRYLLRIENENYLKDYYFFCGQMVYIEGHLKNNEIFAQKIIFGVQATGYTLSETYIRGFFQEPAPYLVYAINGPLFNKSDVNLNLFLKTLNYIANENPHALIINGPILNVDNSMIASGEIKFNNSEDESTNYFDAFEIILEMVIKIFNDKKTTIILCPSLNDATTFYPLPLPPYNLSYLNRNIISNSDFIRKGRLKLIANPQLFQLNEIIYGVANFDVVKDMISNSVRSSNKVPLDSSLDMILQQRSFYPLLPNTVTDDIDKIDKNICIDERKIKNFHLNAIPDIIITYASNMNPFVKKISNTLFINPGSLYKASNPGTILKIASHAPNNVTGIDIISRLKVDVLKLNFK